MKDTSKANWPEKMTALRVFENGDYAYKVLGEEEIIASIYAVDKETLEHRTKHFRALPVMVALLREIAEHDETFWYDRAQDILRSIGEVE